jgi:enoyl-CoA hydratase/carnithine racemase
MNAIQYEVADRVATITLNRPGQLNASTAAMRNAPDVPPCDPRRTERKSR